MRKIVFILAVISGSFLSCKKDPPPAPPVIAMLSPNGGESYHAGDSITVTWSSENFPFGSVILAEISNSIPFWGTQEYVLQPQNEESVMLYGKPVPSTIDDGQETFLLPAKGADLYKYTDTAGIQEAYGTEFKIHLIVIFPSPGAWTTVDPNTHRFFEAVSENYITITSP